MFKKLLNVGKGHLNTEKLQQQQQQQKNLFQLNEIRSYGFSHLCCLGYSPTLSLLAVGSKFGLLRVLGQPSVEFSHQLESGNSIRQVEFVDCRSQVASDTGAASTKKIANAAGVVTKSEPQKSASAKIVVLTDNGQLHLFELKTIKQHNFADNTTQTDGADCCQSQQQAAKITSSSATPEFTKLERVGQLDYFKFRPDDEDRSRRVTTLEVAGDGQSVFVGTEGGDLYQVPFNKFEPIDQQVQQTTNNNEEEAATTKVGPVAEATKKQGTTTEAGVATPEDETTVVNLNDEPQIGGEVEEPFEVIKFDQDIVGSLGDDVKSKKQGAIESIKRHPSVNGKLLLSYHRGLNVVYDVKSKTVDKYFYHNQVLESSCFTDQAGDFFYTSHNDGSYIKWDTRQGSQAKANEDFLGQLYGPYPCKPTLKIQACTGLVNDQPEDLIIFSGGMPRATYDDKNPVTIVRAEADGKDTMKTVLDFTSKVLDFVVITRPRGQLGSGAKSSTTTTGGGGKKNKHKKEQQQQQQRNTPIAVALAILAEEEFVVIDLLNSESYLEFALPYLNCVHSSAITCNQHYSDVSDELYEQLLAHNRQQLRGKLSANEWPITGGKVIDAPEVKTHDILLTGHEDGSVDFWDVSDLSMRHLLHLSTARFFSTNEDDLAPIENDAADGKDNQQEVGNGKQPATEDNSLANDKQDSSAWPPLKRVGRFDPYSDDTRLAIRRLSLCPQAGTLVVAGTGGQVLVFELKNAPSELESLKADEITLVSDQRFTWKGREKLSVRPGPYKLEPGYQLTSYVQLDPPVAATSLDLRSDWHLYALGTSYGFILYDYQNKHQVVTKCTLNVQDFAIVSGDALGAAGAMSRKKSFRKSLRESFRRLRRGRSQRNQPIGTESTTTTTGVTPVVKPAFGRVTTGVRTLNAPSGGQAATTGVVEVGTGGAQQRCNIGYSTERQVEPKVELSSIVKCITLTSAVITNNASFKPTLWVGTNSGQVLVYAIDLATKRAPADVTFTEAAGEVAANGEAPVAAPTATAVPATTTARLAKEIQLKHRAPIIAIFTSPECPPLQPAAISTVLDQDASTRSSPEKHIGELMGADNKQLDADGAKTAAETPIESADGEPRAQTPAPSAQQQQPEKGSPGSPSKGAVKGADGVFQQPRVLICSEEQFKVFNLPNLKPFCKFKLTAHEGLRAKKISITQFLKPAPASGNTGNKQSGQQGEVNAAATNALSSSKSLQSFATQTSPSASPAPPTDGDSGVQANGKQESNNNSTSALNNNHTTDNKELLNAKFGAKSSAVATESSKQEQQQQQEATDSFMFEPYMVCMSNQGDCAVYSVPDLKRQAQIQVCKREDVNGITSTMLTNYGEGYYLKSSSNFLRFSISSQRVPRVLSMV